MPDPRLELALELVGPGDWEFFESFAAEFLAIRFPSLRTTASPSGDRGRDGQLYLVGEELRTALQYSVAKDWHGKILSTVARLKETLPSVRELVYATSQLIGPDADELRDNLWRQNDMALDVCDRTWFLDRAASAPQRIAASEEMIERKVKPILVERRLTDTGGLSLDAAESRLALLHLALESSDETTNKGLTKSSFEALTLAALHGTALETALTRSQIVERVKRFLPAGNEQQVAELVQSALGRLTRREGPVHYITKFDVYHLSYAEQQRLAIQTSQFLLDELELEDQLIDELRRVTGLPIADDQTRTGVGKAVRAAVEAILFRKGELFAVAAKTGQINPIGPEEIVAAIPPQAVPESITAAQVATAATDVLERPREGVRAHLLRLADGYTLFAFLRQTPDVQKMVVKILSDGDIWLDTSVLLPLFAETLIESSDRRPFTLTFRAAQDAGMRLYVTDGVVEEVERHMNRCLVFSSTEGVKWHGRVPYIYAAYSASGQAREGFAQWLEEFRGASRPVEDLTEYLDEIFRIERRNLTEYSDPAPLALRAAVQELWAEIHDRRRLRGQELSDPGTVYRLVAHDVENCVGVLELRKRSARSTLGYRHWWLTLDGAAFRLGRWLRDSLGNDAPLSPALSPDYLVQILRIGPMRTAVETDRRVNLPLLLDFSRLDVTPPELVKSADELRRSMAGVSEHVLRRRVRDELDEIRASYGSAVFSRALQTIAANDVDEDDRPEMADRS